MDNATLDQYARQILVDAIGYDGQERLLATRVVVRGSDWPADWTERYLRAAGVGVTRLYEEGSAVEVTAGPLRWEFRAERELGVGYVMGQLGLTLATVVLALAEAPPDNESETNPNR